MQTRTLGADTTAALAREHSLGQRRRTRNAVRRTLLAYAFIGPFMALFVVFHVVPFIWALYLSGLKGDLVQPNKPFVGLQNYVALTADTITLQVFRNTLSYVVVAVPFGVITGMAIAFLIASRFVRGRSFFRGAVYFPLLMSGAAVAQVWSYLMAPQFGLLSYLLKLVGLGDIFWLSDPKIALYAILIINWWGGIGGNVILFLAAMLGIPRELQEAARVDGANGWQVATRVTIPLMRPVVLFVVVMSTIGTFQLFDTVFVLTNGGPVNSTATMVWFVYNYAFRYGQVGMGAAMGVVLLLIIMPISLLQMRILRQNWGY